MKSVSHTILLLNAIILGVTGCSGLSRTEAARLARHPAHETRMSDHAEVGYVLTGVWRIRGIQNTVYLIGTSHVIADDAVPFPSSFYAAYADSQIVYVEFNTDLSWWTKLRLMPRIVKWYKANGAKLIPPRGQTLSNYLAGDTLDALHRRFGKDFSHEHITPSFLLLQNEMDALDPKDELKSSGVEEPFMTFARRDGKPLRELDDADVLDSAFQALDLMLRGYQREIARRGVDAVVRETLLNRPSESDAVWRYSDLADAVHAQEDMKQESAEMYDKALRERNRNWMRKLEPLLRGHQNALVLVGAAHLPGDDGLLHLLRTAGFPVSQMYGVDRP